MRRLLSYLKRVIRGGRENQRVNSHELHAKLLDTLLIAHTPAHVTYRQLLRNLDVRGGWFYEDQQTDCFTRWERAEVFYRRAGKERHS